MLYRKIIYIPICTCTATISHKRVTKPCTFPKGTRVSRSASLRGTACDVSFLLQGRFLTLLQILHALVLKLFCFSLLHPVFLFMQKQHDWLFQLLLPGLIDNSSNFIPFFFFKQRKSFFFFFNFHTT